MANKANNKSRSRTTLHHPARRMRRAGRRWSWHKAARALNVSVRYLRSELYDLPPELEAKLEAFISGD